MKRKLHESTILYSLLSLGVAVLFILMGIGSSPFELQLFEEMAGIRGYEGQGTTYLGNGTYQDSVKWETHYTLKKGKKDKYGKWDGAIILEHWDYGFPIKLFYTEEFIMVNGRRHGRATTKYWDGSTRETCYKMGHKVECLKSGRTLLAGSSAFNIMTDKYPWFYNDLVALNFDSEYIESFMDTLEVLLYSNDFDEYEFDDYYQESLDILAETVYDTLITGNTYFTYREGRELLKNSEFRMAVIDAYRDNNPDTYHSLQKTYPTYLNMMNSGGISYQDFETFCQDFDSILNTYVPLVKEDPFYTDTIDTRIGQALFTILSEDDSTRSAVLSLKSAKVPEQEINLNGSLQQMSSLLREMKTDSVSQNVALVIVAFMFMEYDQADVVKKSVREAYYLNKNITTFPVVTTEFSGNNSTTSATLTGYVLENGGDEVTARGLAWAEFYNPAADGQTVSGGSGNGGFTATLENLTPGTTYYARAFATNSLGTAYGNCVSFIAGAIGVNEIKEDDRNLIIYPNPASTSATFTFVARKSGNFVLSIYNTKGQVYYSANIQADRGEFNHEVNFSGYPSGVYICTLSDGLTSRSRKLLISQ